MAKNEIVFTGNATEILKEYRKLQQENAKLEKGIGRTKKASSEAAKESRQMAREATRVWEQTRKPIERYKQEADRLKHLLAEGTIDQETFNRALDQAKERFKQAKQSTSEYREEQRRLEAQQKRTNDEQREAKQIVESLRTPYERYEARVKRLSELLRKGRLTQDQYNRALRKSQDDFEKASRSQKKFSSAVVGSVAGFVSFGAALSKVLETQREYREEVESTTLAMDKMNRTFAVQAGLNVVDSMESRRRILQSARENAVSPEVAFNAATQLVSSGFSADQASGDALNSALQIRASANASGMDPTELVRAAAQLLAAEGTEKSGAELLRAGINIRGLFAANDVQLADLSEYAKIAAGLQAAGVDRTTGLSAFTALRNKLPAGESGTALRNVVSSLTTAGAQKVKVDTLSEIGLTPQDVDLVGETLPEALRKLKAAIDAAAPERQQIALTRLFERENASKALLLLNGVDSFETFAQQQNDIAGFAQGVQTAQSGPNAARQRLQVTRAQIALRDEQAATREAVAKEILTNADIEFFQQRGPVGFLNALPERAARDLMIGLGLRSRESFLGEGFREQIDQSMGSGVNTQRIEQQLGRVADELSRNSQVTTENTRRTGTPPHQPVPVPAAALGN